MKVSFTHAYESVLNLENCEAGKVGFLFSSHFERVERFVEFFVLHSAKTTKRIKLSLLAKMLAPDGVNVPYKAKNKILDYMEMEKAEFIILEDTDNLAKNFLLVDELCDVIREFGKENPIVVVSEHAAELSIVYGLAKMIDIPGLNERTLKIKPSRLGTEELYLRNQCEAIKTGIFWANMDFFINYIENKNEGDKLFEVGNYQDAFSKYNDAISFHSKYDESDCLMNDFLGLVLYVRCIACFLYGQWPERTCANTLMKETTDKLIKKLRKSNMSEYHGKMLKDYDLTISGLIDGWLEKTNYLLFLKEYIF